MEQNTPRVQTTDLKGYTPGQAFASRPVPLPVEDPHRRPLRVAAPAPAPLARRQALDIDTGEIPWPIRLVIFIALMVICSLLWLVGSSASLDGWRLGLNLVSQVIKADIIIPPVRGLERLPLIILVGVAYSLLELFVRAKRTYHPAVLIVMVALMLFAHGTDIGSTFLAVMTPGPNAWPLHTWAAAEGWPAVLYSVLITYFPELGIWGAIRILRGKYLLSGD